LAFGLGLVAQEDRPAVGLADQAEEAVGETVVAVLGDGDFDIAVAGEFFAHGREGVAVAVEGFVEAAGEEARLEAGGAENGLLSEGHPFEGEEFLRVDWLIDGDEVVFEIGDFLGVFQADDGEGGSSEAVLGGVLSGAGFAFGGLGTGGMGGVGSVRG
jgi:hypothetical protein